MTVKTFKLTVRGSGLFPYDMLRYDQCYPVSVNDSMMLDSPDLDIRKAKREVNLYTAPRLLGPTVGRWESFGWKVVSSEEIS